MNKFKVISIVIIIIGACLLIGSGLYWNMINIEQSYFITNANLTKEEASFRINIIQISSILITFGFGLLIIFSIPDIIKDGE